VSTRAEIEASIERLRSPERMEGWPQLLRDTLDRIRSLPPDEAVEVIDSLLASGKLDPYTDTRGVPCRAVLVDAKVKLGWPHALSVDPEDLAYLRQVERSQTALGRGLGISRMVLWLVLAAFLPASPWRSCSPC
jgi:hypothetical protein